MRIVYRGNFQPHMPLDQRWSTESQVAATLEGMGHEVFRSQEVPAGAHPGDTWAETVEACMAGPTDLFLWTCTGNVDPDGGYLALAELRRRAIPSAGFHLDLYWGLARAVQLLEHPFFRCDFVFTADGGHQEGFARNGIEHHWSPPAIYRPDAVRGGIRPEYRPWPLIFVGSYPYPHPEHAEARRDIITWLQSGWGRQFRHYRGGIRGQALADLYATATVIVGDSCLAGRVPRYWSDRIPETLGRGGFLIHPYVPGIEEHYEDGRHLRLFEPGDMGHLTTLVRHYLAHPHKAAEIGAAGREKVLAADTYHERMARLLATVGLVSEPEREEVAADAV